MLSLMEETTFANLNKKAHSCQTYFSFLSNSKKWLLKKLGACSMTYSSLEYPAIRTRQIMTYLYIK